MFIFRTRQEEMRSRNQRNPSNAYELNSNDTVNKIEIAQELSKISKDPSNPMSTEFCIYIHAAFIASILIMGNIRLESIKYDKCPLSFFFSHKFIGNNLF